MAIATLANRRDTLALHAKLDELLPVDHAAWSELTQLDEQEPEVIARHRDEEVRRDNRELNTARR
jgi:low affinity Fe/Cu permease